MSWTVGPETGVNRRGPKVTKYTLRPVQSVPTVFKEQGRGFTQGRRGAAGESYGHRPAHPYNTGAEHVGLSPTRQTSLAPSGRGWAYCFVTCLSHLTTLTTHPFRDGAPFLLLLETPPTFGRSLRFLHVRVYVFV